ncbi:hypothetical protein [Spartinivicinus poritis]|uniref:AttH domain-containing protein n=1 Tax=Spartinivicinus poritis TaxID=2994640 RepID=A0ABT5U567_9GAMM|nr:hypothetical protein [Spartinivicinus sp. A2-2]MDE1461496.1 hypothetical protein [Spartinivicinus sp. A2-2]
MLKTLLLTCFIVLFSNAVSATTLEDIKPHSPTKKPWSEQWFYYLNDPAMGYFKISLQTYIMPDSPTLKEKGYVHVVYAPKEGKMQVYDYFFDEVMTQSSGSGSTAFHYSIPGKVDANDKQITLTLPDFNFSMQFISNHKHYWSGRNPGQTPYGFITDIPFVGGKWFIFTMGTSVQYSYSDNDESYGGYGTVYLDKGWYTKEDSPSFMYILGINDKQQLMMTGAAAGSIPIELWAGRYLSQQSDITLYPAIAGLSMKRTLDACKGELHIEFNKLTKKITVDAKANINDFYISRMPSMLVLGGDQPIMKSMKATLDVNVYEFGQLTEQVNFPQGVLEFGGNVFCDDILSEPNPQ